jgi:hypothetical protein
MSQELDNAVDRVRRLLARLNNEQSITMLAEVLRALLDDEWANGYNHAKEEVTL